MMLKKEMTMADEKRVNINSYHISQDLKAIDEATVKVVESIVELNNLDTMATVSKELYDNNLVLIEQVQKSFGLGKFPGQDKFPDILTMG